MRNLFGDKTKLESYFMLFSSQLEIWKGQLLLDESSSYPRPKLGLFQHIGRKSLSLSSVWKNVQIKGQPLLAQVRLPP